MSDMTLLPTWDDEGFIHVVVETPAQSRVKYAYDQRLERFTASRPLGLGIQYPYDWGFIPHTHAEDGDPLDAMVLSTVPSYPGLVYTCKPVGVVRITQRHKGEKRQRNDRIIALPHYSCSLVEEGVDDLLNEQRRKELELFFLHVVELEDKHVRIEGWEGPKAARKIIKASMMGKQ